MISRFFESCDIARDFFCSRWAFPPRLNLVVYIELSQLQYAKDIQKTIIFINIVSKIWPIIDTIQA